MMTPHEFEQQAAQLQQLAWRSIGPRKYLVGKAAVQEITMKIVRRLPAMLSQYALSDNGSAEAERELVKSVTAAMREYRGYDRRYGSIWIILLSAVIGELVRWMIEWWKESREHRDLLLNLCTYQGYQGKDWRECP